MTGCDSPGKCATRTCPCFRSNLDFDTYTTFDILPPSRFFQPIPKWDRCYSIDFACFKKCLDKVAVVLVHFPMLARRSPYSPRRKPFPCIRLEPLCALFSSAALSFQSLAASFPKTPGWGYLRAGCAPSTPARPAGGSRLSPISDRSSMLFRINTYKSVSKQRTLTTFRINTCEKQWEGGIPQLWAKLRFRRHMRHVTPLSPVPSLDCTYFPSPRGCTTP